MRVLVVFSILFFASPLFANEQAEWVRIKNKDGIEVFRAHNDTSRLKTFKVITRFEIEDIRTFIAMLLDGDSYPDWGHMISSAEVTPTDSVYDYGIYMTTTMPWPVSNRHVKGDYHITQSEDYSLRVELTQSEIPPPERKGYILSPEAYGYFALNTVPDSKEVELVTEIFVDPGGYVPAFLVNLITDDLSFYSTKKLRRYVLSQKYQDIEMDFIKRRPWVLQTEGE